MSLFDIFNVAGSGMSAQSVRLNTTASNIANADAVSSSVEGTYRARHPIFEAEMAKATHQQQATTSVKVAGIVESDMPLQKSFHLLILWLMQMVLFTSPMSM